MSYHGRGMKDEWFFPQIIVWVHCTHVKPRNGRMPCWHAPCTMARTLCAGWTWQCAAVGGSGVEASGPELHDAHGGQPAGVSGQQLCCQVRAACLQDLPRRCLRQSCTAAQLHSCIILCTPAGVQPSDWLQRMTSKGWRPACCRSQGGGLCCRKVAPLERNHVPQEQLCCFLVSAAAWKRDELAPSACYAVSKRLRRSASMLTCTGRTPVPYSLLSHR